MQESRYRERRGRGHAPKPMAGQIRSLSEDSQPDAQHNAKWRRDHRQQRGVDQKLADPRPPDKRPNLSPAGLKRRGSHEAKRNERDQRDKQGGGADPRNREPPALPTWRDLRRWSRYRAKRVFERMPTIMEHRITGDRPGS
jgi:hypothetical protein